MKITLAACAALAVSTIATPAFAQADGTSADAADNSGLSDEAKRLQRELDILTRERDLLKTQAEIAAQYAALVPDLTASSQTLTSENAGALEANLIGTAVLARAAQEIAQKLVDHHGGDTGNIILLAGNEQRPWGDALIVKTLIGHWQADLDDKIVALKGGTTKSLVTTATIVSTVVSLASELAATETTVGAVPFTTTDSRLIRIMLGANDAFRLPKAASRIEPDNPLVERFEALRQTIADGTAALPRLAKGQDYTPKQAALKKSLDAASALVKQLTTPDGEGRLPLYSAARYSRLLEGDAKVANVDVAFSGSSVFSRKTLRTRFFGYDGVRMAAGIDATYSIENLDGTNHESAAMLCRSGYEFISDLMESNVDSTKRPTKDSVVCTTVGAERVTPKTVPSPD